MQKNKKIAKILLDIGCVNINFIKPFTLTSGKLSPVYVDCRKLISFPKEREIIINEMIKQIQLKYKKNIYVAGGETAGIPYAALIAQLSKKSNYQATFIENIIKFKSPTSLFTDSGRGVSDPTSCTVVSYLIPAVKCQPSFLLE